MNPIDSIHLTMPLFTKKEKLIADFILSDPIRVVQYTADEIANGSQSSKSAFIRMCQKMGYQGFSEFKFAFSRYLVSNPIPTHEESNSIADITSSYCEFITKINQTVTLEQVQKLVQQILTAKRFKVLGINRTGLAASQLRMRLSKIGIDCECITDQIIMKDVAASLGQNDFCLIFSIKAMSTYSAVADHCLSNGTPITLITMSPTMPLAKQVNEVITLPFISRAGLTNFLDDQAILFVFVEILINEIGKTYNKSNKE